MRRGCLPRDEKVFDGEEKQERMQQPRPEFAGARALRGLLRRGEAERRAHRFTARGGDEGFARIGGDDFESGVEPDGARFGRGDARLGYDGLDAAAGRDQKRGPFSQGQRPGFIPDWGIAPGCEGKTSEA